MRPVRDISAEENFRVEGDGRAGFIRRDPVEPEPVGTIVLMPFRITGYDPDCDGSLMPRLQNIDSSGDWTGWEVNAVGIDPNGALVVTPDELRALFGR